MVSRRAIGHSHADTPMYAKALVALVTAILVSTSLVAFTATAVRAADPEEDTIVVQEEGTDQADWTGTVPPGAGSTAVCAEGANADVFILHVELPDGITDHEEDAQAVAEFYETHTATLSIEIRWDPAVGTAGGGSDLELLVVAPDDEQQSSDGGSAREEVTFIDPIPGDYDVYACAFLSGPQPYLGHAEVTTTSLAALENPAATPGDQRYSPITISDPQRDVAEPSLRIDPQGNEYTCGPFGASRAADYAQKSEDGGDTFRNLGLPPEGRIAPGGGGDCELAVAPLENELGYHTLSYTGLEALVNFSTSSSRDAGRSFTGTFFSESPVAVDRQWLDAAGQDTTYLTYRQIPLGSFVQQSTDGGLTYDTGTLAIPQISISGNLLVDRATEEAEGTAENANTIYVAHTFGNEVRIARSFNNHLGPYDILTVMEDCPEGETDPAVLNRCISGDPSSIFPSIAQDSAGTLYAAWVEAGTYNVYYSFCTPNAENVELDDNDEVIAGDCTNAPLNWEEDEETGDPVLVEPTDDFARWSPKVQVNRDDVMTTVLPWVTAGDPGKIAVSFYGTTVNGNPEIGTFRGPWDTYVNTIMDADNVDPEDPNATAVSQTAVTTHPIHWDSICLGGLGCSVTGGDRTLLDFFQVDHDPQGRIRVAYNESNKRYGDPAGPIAIVTYSKQTGGADLIGGPEAPDPRPVVADFRDDPAEDALFPFSIFPAPAEPPVGFRENHPAMDILNVTAAEGDADGEPGVTFTMTIADLSAAAREEAQAGTASPNLLFVVRFFSGFTAHSAVASMSPLGSFTFGYSDLTLSPDGKLEIYPQTEPIPGSVDEETGVITMTVPYSLIEHVTPADPPQAEPEVREVQTLDRIYEITGFTFGNPLGSANAQYFLNTVDVSPPFDHILGAVEPGPGETPGTSPGTSPAASPRRPGGGAPLPNTADDGFGAGQIMMWVSAAAALGSVGVLGALSARRMRQRRR